MVLDGITHVAEICPESVMLAHSKLKAAPACFVREGAVKEVRVPNEVYVIFIFFLTLAVISS
jgi:hypothetical protein